MILLSLHYFRVMFSDFGKFQNLLDLILTSCLVSRFDDSMLKKSKSNYSNTFVSQFSISVIKK